MATRATRAWEAGTRSGSDRDSAYVAADEDTKKEGCTLPDDEAGYLLPRGSK